MDNCKVGRKRQAQYYISYLTRHTTSRETTGRRRTHSLQANDEIETLHWGRLFLPHQRFQQTIQESLSIYTNIFYPWAFLLFTIPFFTLCRHMFCNPIEDRESFQDIYMHADEQRRLQCAQEAPNPIDYSDAFAVAEGKIEGNNMEKIEKSAKNIYLSCHILLSAESFRAVPESSRRTGSDEGLAKHNLFRAAIHACVEVNTKSSLFYFRNFTNCKL